MFKEILLVLLFIGLVVVASVVLAVGGAHIFTSCVTSYSYTTNIDQ